MTWVLILNLVPDLRTADDSSFVSWLTRSPDWLLFNPKVFRQNQIDALDPDNFSTAFPSADWVRFWSIKMLPEARLLYFLFRLDKEIIVPKKKCVPIFIQNLVIYFYSKKKESTNLWHEKAVFVTHKNQRDFWLWIFACLRRLLTTENWRPHSVTGHLKGFYNLTSVYVYHHPTSLPRLCDCRYV